MRQTRFQCIDVREADDLIQHTDVLVLDVRAADAFMKDHVEGARQVSIYNLSTVIENTARSRPILIYCYHGYASREYAQVFIDFGFQQVYSLDGGYEAWADWSQAEGVLDEALQK